MQNENFWKILNKIYFFPKPFANHKILCFELCKNDKNVIIWRSWKVVTFAAVFLFWIQSYLNIEESNYLGTPVVEDGIHR